MGISMEVIKQLDDLNVFSPHCSVFDIGSSNLYQANENEIRDFVEKYGKKKIPDEYIKKLSLGSEYIPGVGGKNESWAGELFESAGFEYLSFDIAKGYKTRVFDLNSEKLDSENKGKADIIINCGTTEHVIGQLNTFSVVHDMAKVDGFISHQVPHVGFSNHGYFNYTGRFFFDMASFNGYEIVSAWFNHGGHESILSSTRDYLTYFPTLSETLENTPNIDIPTVSISILFKKKKRQSFIVGLETSTSVHAEMVKTPSYLKSLGKRGLNKIRRSIF